MSTNENVKPPRALLAGVALAVVVVAAAGYAVTGTPRLALNAPQAQQAEPGEAQIRAMVDRLAERLKQQPDDAEGWTMLGRSYLVLGRAPDAVAAYREALKRRPDDAKTMTEVAGALALANGQSMTDEALALANRAIAKEPDNLKALSLVGSAAFDRGDWAAAVKAWERIVALAPPGAEFVAEVQSGIDEARRRGNLPAPAGTGSAPAAAPAQAVAGRVTLAEALRGKVSPEDTVFVFARAAEGPRMPLAIVRKQVKDLPFDFVLDDSLAMNPAMKLSSVPRVIVGARISKSGDAMPRAGDLTGQSEPVAPGAKGLALEISQVVPGP